MKIISGYIEGFGCLAKKELSFGEGLNTVCSENGTGKSTLIAFIKAMLFGIGDTKKLSLFDNERKRYAPWDGGSFGGSLTVEVGARRFRIERAFGKRPSEDSFRLFDAVTGLESREYGEHFGKELLGIDADGAERTVFLTEKNLLPTTESPTISAAVTGAVGNITEADKLGDALELLDKQRRRYVRRGGGGEIDLCREKIDEAKRRLSRLDSLLLREKAENEELTLMAQKLERLSSDTEGVRSRQSDLVTKNGHTSLSFLLILSLLLCALFIGAGVLFSPIFYALAAFFGAFCTVLFIIRKRKRTSRLRADYERLEGERWDLDTVRTNLIEERAELIRRHEQTLDEIGELKMTRSRLSGLYERLTELEGELSVIMEAAQHLRAAGEALAEKHVGGAKASFGRYLDVFSESEGLSLDTELKITKTEGGKTHPYESYSRATRDLYALAARLAAADAIFGGECPFIVLDDPFSAFDDKRLATALDFIRELAKTRQVIYFTASRARLPG